MSLIQMQDAAIAAMSESRTSQKRTNKHIRAVLAAYRRKAEKLGYTEEQVDQQVRDIRDMYALQCVCDDADEETERLADEQLGLPI